MAEPLVYLAIVALASAGNGIRQGPVCRQPVQRPRTTPTGWRHHHTGRPAPPWADDHEGSCRHNEHHHL
jgi:hypothetical protein